MPLGEFIHVGAGHQLIPVPFQGRDRQLDEVDSRQQVVEVVQLQVVQHEKLENKAITQQTREISSTANRGTIYDANGDILAISGSVQNVILSPRDVLATVKDVSANPKKLKFKELEAATLPRVLTQVDLALINTNYALEAKLNPETDALVIEGSDSPYVNILVARPDDKDSADMQKLVAALHTPEVKAFILEKYKGAIVPAF